METESEPVGIIIAFGAPAAESPRVVAYEWAPVPVSELEPAEAVLAA